MDQEQLENFEESNRPSSEGQADKGYKFEIERRKNLSKIKKFFMLMFQII